MNITVLGLTNPDVNLKRMHQLYNVINILSVTLNDVIIMSCVSFLSNFFMMYAISSCLLSDSLEYLVLHKMMFSIYQVNIK